MGRFETCVAVDSYRNRQETKARGSGLPNFVLPVYTWLGKFGLRDWLHHLSDRRLTLLPHHACTVSIHQRRARHSQRVRVIPVLSRDSLLTGQLASDPSRNRPRRSTRVRRLIHKDMNAVRILSSRLVQH